MLEESWTDGKRASKLRHALIQTKDGHWIKVVRAYILKLKIFSSINDHIGKSVAHLVLF